MRFALLNLQSAGSFASQRWTLSRLLVVALLVFPTALQAAAEFESRTWTDRKGNQLTSTFVDAKNGEVQLKNSEGTVNKFKLADFAEPDQKYLRDLANYRRKLAAGEPSDVPADPAKASLEIQPRQTNTEPVPDMAPFRKPLLEFPIRTWTDSTGKKVQGKLVTAYNDKIVLDVKGNVFDLPITRISPDDQLYVSIQLKGLQRDDLVDVLAKAANIGQQPAAAAPPPTTVAANTPPAPLGTDDIKARLEQLRAQREANNPNAGVAANKPPGPLGTEDIRARLAQIRQQKGQPEPAHMPTTAPTASGNNPELSPAERMRQQLEAHMERDRQASQARLAQQQADAKARQDEFERTSQHAKMTRETKEALASGGPAAERLTKQCGKCGRALPDRLTAGDKCPGCGIEFDFDETNGKRTAGSIAGNIGGGIFLILIIVAGVKKLFGGG